jgi:hypothetical protein
VGVSSLERQRLRGISRGGILPESEPGGVPESSSAGQCEGDTVAEEPGTNPTPAAGRPWTQMLEAADLLDRVMEQAGPLGQMRPTEDTVGLAASVVQARGLVAATEALYAIREELARMNDLLAQRQG